VKLNERQRRFADEYIISGMAYPAAIEAGYSEKYAKVSSHKLLDNVRIKAYIDKRLDELKSERVADQQEILELLTSIARGSIQASVLIGIGGGAEEITDDMPPTMNERIKAAELLGNRHAMWTDKQQIENVTPVFVNDVPADD